jgi:hypothetical protein
METSIINPPKVNNKYEGVYLLCPICKTEFEPKRYKQVYCSTKCFDRGYYLTHKEQFKATANKWEKNNPERCKEIKKKSMLKFRTEKREQFNQLIRNDYKKHKDKWYSRNRTKEILRGIRNRPEIVHACKLCGTKDFISLKYSIYPQNSKDIREAIKDKKIYYVCKDCRRKV